MISSHASSFAGLPEVAFTPGARLPQDPSAVAWRLEVEEFDAPPEEFAALVAAFRATVPAAAVRAVVVGDWGNAHERELPVDLLVDAAAEWTGLRALFLADLTWEQCEISWLTMPDITGVLAAYPTLEVLWVRGGNRLRLSPVRHPELRELRFESGGLPGAVVRAVGESELPALHRLEFWLGRADYGADVTLDDLAPVLAGAGLPALRHLGLCNSEIANPIAGAVADAPIVARLETLDLSMGVLDDSGLDALLGGQPLTHLHRLDLHHHYLSEQARRRVVDALPGVEVDLSEEQEPEIFDGQEYRYTEVGE